MNLKHLVAVIAGALLTSSAGAQTQAPGLWEHSIRMRSQGGEMDKAMAEMQKQLASMSPDQRRQMEQMMAGRGVAMGAPGSTIVKVCVSKEQAAHPAEPRLNGDCTQQDVRRSGNTMKFKFRCTRPQPSSGEGEMTFSGDKAYAGKTSMTSQVDGQPQQVTMEMTGKWLGADCGDIKPRALPAK